MTAATPGARARVAPINSTAAPDIWSPSPAVAGDKLRIALVSPYDYPFPGGVTEHIGFLAAGLEAGGHSVSILAPSSADREQLATDRVYRLSSIVRVPYHGSLAACHTTARTPSPVAGVRSEAKPLQTRR